jgi:5-methylcytosine-specific restriction endonuclease McrA
VADFQASTLCFPSQPLLDPADIVREVLRVEHECCRAIERQTACVQVLPDGREILRGDAYRLRRLEVLERDHNRCTRCGSSGLQVHHRIKRSIARDDRHQNLLTLCALCHAKEHPEDQPDQGSTDRSREQCAWRTDTQVQ